MMRHSPDMGRRKEFKKTFDSRLITTDRVWHMQEKEKRRLKNESKLSAFCWWCMDWQTQWNLEEQQFGETEGFPLAILNRKCLYNTQMKGSSRHFEVSLEFTRRETPAMKISVLYQVYLDGKTHFITQHWRRRYRVTIGREDWNGEVKEITSPVIRQTTHSKR